MTTRKKSLDPEIVHLELNHKDRNIDLQAYIQNDNEKENKKVLKDTPLLYYCHVITW